MFMLITGQHKHFNLSSPWTLTKASLLVGYVKSMSLCFFGIALIISLLDSIVTLYQLLVFLFLVNCLLRCFINLCVTRNLFPFRLSTHHVMFEESNNEYLFAMKF